MIRYKHLILFIISIAVIGHGDLHGASKKNKVEMLHLSSPSDDLLCDAYEGSNGHLSYKIYRFKKSKKIVKVMEESSYCQGDSEKFIFHLFDKEGFIYFSKQYGIYQPTIITLYRKGKPVKIIEYSAELSTPRKRIFKKTKENRIVAAKDFEDRVIALKKDIRQRKRELEDYVSNKKKFGNPGKIKKEVLKKEARKTIKELSNSLKKTGYSGTYFYRKPRQNEDAMITGKNVRVRNKPGTKSKVIATVSSYDFSFLVMSIGKSETIRPWGTHKWHKVSNESRTGKVIEGWVFGAFIAPDVFPVK